VPIVLVRFASGDNITPTAAAGVTTGSGTFTAGTEEIEQIKWPRRSSASFAWKTYGHLGNFCIRKGRQEMSHCGRSSRVLKSIEALSPQAFYGMQIRGRKSNWRRGRVRTSVSVELALEDVAARLNRYKAHGRKTVRGDCKFVSEFNQRDLRTLRPAGRARL
jgi:hypothetical protein